MIFKLEKIHKAVNWNKEDDGFTQAFWEQNVKQFWLPEEISVSKDLKVFNELNEKEKELYKKVLGGLTLLDTKQGNDGVPSMMSLTDNLQRKAVLSFMGTMEEIHAKSYSSIFMTLLSNDEIEELFKWIESEETLQKKADLVLAQYKNTKDEESLYLSMVTSVFLESFLFYSGFFYPLYLAGQGKMVASGEIISLILRDESLHGKYIGLLSQEIYEKFEEAKKEELKDRMYKILEDLMENEINYTNTIYKDSGLESEVINFLKYNANRALENLGFNEYYKVSEINPIVLNGLSTETKNHDFFSTKGNGYQKGVYEELKDEDFLI
ncbi:class 1b ribonucleoside-diphosphate reductase subunit beta [Romboutsia sp. 1001216sp1]|uniref:class 1b ribonucleoside-diphosphate reductase subunit beta n=1 Tax=Romboutsia sp. 1001216sp1 TaxID=2986997 RepID=UPI00232E6108|nr:class 1b ribonucleoside-diphosphate reductase subunit beta [Romboutsia sp. 1001216sp1]MDB8805620.1 class 1b ribonucleoside-diphosphate reductase subunit beta [Romboutsia sp. 1001216sp1]MDB8808656.1 class 1b ribonucleoside-diphosphate reductase subunit beta [Romboutsia sp. 1001216sp1]MDB8811095.1 class 1b ribonucleoside-diphosphate reductase subunit beta [Romboutsia sp. 1001216sp1]MDB8816815.1 class 1b ribonucleoside-diphosphate reductase subunit beta [Romboutsia sp. 1001216sp1]MDB8820062.1 